MLTSLLRLPLSLSTIGAKLGICSYDELVKDYDVTYVAGGAAQNAARAAAVSKCTTF